MRVFAVLLDEPSQNAVQRLNDAYPENTYQVTDTSFLVRTSDLAEDIAVSAGIKGSDRIASGVVFKLNRAYAGYSSRALWEWLGEVEE